jgi:hypothetical protein
MQSPIQRLIRFIRSVIPEDPSQPAVFSSVVTRVFRVLCALLHPEGLKAFDASTHTMSDSISETSERVHPYEHTVARISQFVVLKIAESVG